MSSENLSRWSGLLIAIGGALWLLPWVLNLSQNIMFILTIPALILIAIGLIGFYRRISSGPGDNTRLALGGALLGLFLVMLSAAGGLLMGVESNADVPGILQAFLGIGMLLFVLGLAGLSIVGYSRKALGPWSFTAPLLALIMLAYVISIVLAISGVGSDSFVTLLEVAAIACWLLFGFGFWSSQTAETEPSLI